MSKQAELAGKCPVCGADNALDYGNTPEFDNGDMYFVWTCLECRTKGREWYTIDFYEHQIIEINDPSNPQYDLGNRKVTLEIEEYMAGGLCIEMYEGHECWDVLTTKIPDVVLSGPNCAYVQDNYLTFVIGQNLGTLTGKDARSGYNLYYEIEFFDHIVQRGLV